MKATIKIILSLVIIALIIIIVSPYYQLYRLNKAYDKGDYQTIVQAVDFDTLRTNLKRRLHDKIDALVHQVPNELKSLVIGEEKLNSFAYAMIDGMVDEVITQDNAMRLARGDVQAATQGVGLFAIIGMHGQNGLSHEEYTQKSEQANVEKSDKNYKLNYCGLNCFSIKTQVNGENIDIRMTRHGLIDWKIDDVIFP